MAPEPSLPKRYIKRAAQVSNTLGCKIVYQYAALIFKKSANFQ
jgi:hypothetical protein